MALEQTGALAGLTRACPREWLGQLCNDICHMPPLQCLCQGTASTAERLRDPAPGDDLDAIPRRLAGFAGWLDHRRDTQPAARALQRADGLG